jgi:hypothetical protein
VKDLGKVFAFFFVLFLPNTRDNSFYLLRFAMKESTVHCVGTFSPSRSCPPGQTCPPDCLQSGRRFFWATFTLDPRPGVAKLGTGPRVIDRIRRLINLASVTARSGAFRGHFFNLVEVNASHPVARTQRMLMNRRSFETSGRDCCPDKYNRIAQFLYGEDACWLTFGPSANIFSRFIISRSLYYKTRNRYQRVKAGLLRRARYRRGEVAR